MRLLTSLLRFVQYTSMKHNIDESHALGHSMKILDYTHKIYLEQRVITPKLIEQEPVFYSAAILHDMYDHKYVNTHILDKFILIRVDVNTKGIHIFVYKICHEAIHICI